MDSKCKKRSCLSQKMEKEKTPSFTEPAADSSPSTSPCLQENHKKMRGLQENGPEAEGDDDMDPIESEVLVLLDFPELSHTHFLPKVCSVQGDEVPHSSLDAGKGIVLTDLDGPQPTALLGGQYKMIGRHHKPVGTNMFFRAPRNSMSFNEMRQTTTAQGYVDAASENTVQQANASFGNSRSTGGSSQSKTVSFEGHSTKVIIFEFERWKSGSGAPIPQGMT